jgi:hypothetical protein
MGEGVGADEFEMLVARVRDISVNRVHIDFIARRG